ncbi:hypothetical protein, partial [Parendozoicomonas sp. Alg238-R29]|uniref:hypothetical protein n=1 Tax=Parendozoicomonas sp. Alg238-R29 TaxID=2993446 RepID=UPI00248E5A6D
MSSLDAKIRTLKIRIKDPEIPMLDNLASLHELLAIQPNSPDLLCLKADLHYELAAVQDMSSEEKPIDLYKKAVFLDENNYTAVTKLASYMYLVLEDYAGSLQYFEKSLELKVDADILSQFSDALASLNRIDEAMRIPEHPATDSVYIRHPILMPSVQWV